MGTKMYRLFTWISILAGALSVSACVTTPVGNLTYTVEILKFNGTNQGLEKPVIAMIAIPLKAKRPLPVIITQLGSSRVGIVLPGGRGQTAV